MPRSKPAAITAHVTELEMTSPPKQSLPMPINIHTAILRVSDIPLAYYRFLYLRVGKRWHWAERLRMSDDDLAAILHDKRTTVMVLYVDGAPAGFFESSNWTMTSSTSPISGSWSTRSAWDSASGSCCRPCLRPGP